MNLDFLERFLPLLTARTGLHVREKDRHVLARALEARLQESALSPDEYLRELERDTALTGEWKTLMPRLTNGESYFLRDKGQISLLRDRILPELIESRRKERTLRVWSAGCSTGEEPYTLAMLINELLPHRADWQVSVLGTDINEAALEKAQQAVYGSWAFRSVPDEVRTRYFQETANGLEIRPDLRALVKFAPLNLRGNGYPSRASGLAELDLILCRNVLIYFGREAVAHTLQSFAASLRTGGYLLTGHAELAGHDPAPLAVRTFSQSVAYQKAAVPVPPKAAAAPIAVPAPPRVALPAASSVAPSRSALPKVPAANLPRPSVPAPPRLPAAAPRKPMAVAASPVAGGALPNTSAAEHCAAARVAANAGRYDEAVKHCRLAIAADAVNIEAYTLWAHVTDEQGDAVEAKNLWKKVVYLAPSHIRAYVELGSLYEREGDARRSRQMRETALSLLRAADVAGNAHHAGDAAERDALTRYLQDRIAGGSGTPGSTPARSQIVGGRRG